MQQLSPQHRSRIGACTARPLTSGAAIWMPGRKKRRTPRRHIGVRVGVLGEWCCLAACVPPRRRLTWCFAREVNVVGSRARYARNIDRAPFATPFWRIFSSHTHDCSPASGGAVKSQISHVCTRCAQQARTLERRGLCTQRIRPLARAACGVPATARHGALRQELKGSRKQRVHRAMRVLERDAAACPAA